VVSRRDFLAAGILSALSPLICFAAPRGVEVFNQDENDRSIVQVGGYPRTLWVKRGHDEMLIDVYTQDGFSRFAWLSRDIRAGNIIGIPDPHLVRQVVWLQARLAQYGYHRPLVMTSGLRTKSTNESTEGAARASRHLPREKILFGQRRQMVFEAIDIELPGVPSSLLASVALEAKDGGVGYYGDDGHVHIDSGPVRFWRRDRHV